MVAHHERVPDREPRQDHGYRRTFLLIGSPVVVGPRAGLAVGVGHRGTRHVGSDDDPGPQQQPDAHERTQEAESLAIGRGLNPQSAEDEHQASVSFSGGS